MLERVFFFSFFFVEERCFLFSVFPPPTIVVGVEV